MPILPVDVTLPAGRMPLDWHTTPDIEAWIALGYGSAPVEADQATADAIATAYTYYRGYSAQADTLLGSPDSVGGIGATGISVSQSNGRYDRMVAQAEVYRLEWVALVASAIPAPEPEVPLRVSRSTSAHINYQWM